MAEKITENRRIPANEKRVYGSIIIVVLFFVFFGICIGNGVNCSVLQEEEDLFCMLRYERLFLDPDYECGRRVDEDRTACHRNLVLSFSCESLTLLLENWLDSLLSSQTNN